MAPLQRIIQAEKTKIDDRNYSSRKESSSYNSSSSSSRYRDSDRDRERDRDRSGNNFLIKILLIRNQEGPF